MSNSEHREEDSCGGSGSEGKLRSGSFSSFNNTVDVGEHGFTCSGKTHELLVTSYAGVGSHGVHHRGLAQGGELSLGEGHDSILHLRHHVVAHENLNEFWARSIADAFSKLLP